MIKTQYKISNPINIYPRTTNIIWATPKSFVAQTYQISGTHYDCCSLDNYVS